MPQIVENKSRATGLANSVVKIRGYEQVTVDWLNGVLQDHQGSAHIPVKEIRLVEQREELASTVFRLEVIRDNADTPLHLFLKISKHGMKGDYAAREVNFYTKLAKDMDCLSLVPCLGGVYYPDCGHSYLLLQDLSTTHSVLKRGLMPEKSQFELIVKCLAVFHSKFWERPGLAKLTGATPYQDFVKGDKAWACAFFPQFLEKVGDLLTAQERAIYTQLLEQGDKFEKQRLKITPITYLHGDCHIWNYLVPNIGIKDTFRMIDWESTEIGPGASDLCYMVGLFFSAEENDLLERSLLRTYHSTLMENGVRDYDWDQCVRDYRLNSVRNLWTPVRGRNFGQPDDLWQGHLRRALRAFEAWDCQEFLR